MSDTIIRVENLGKKYVIRHSGAKRSDTFRDALMNGARSLGRRLRRPWQFTSGASSREDFWALKDVSFEVKRGDVVGIIGRNGAGKSTLLKILSRITEPTTGRAVIDGRVASLLEVGTGFHSELSGRENIYLNGAILGMGRAEIGRKFDEIVAFANVEMFLDTPVKHYSSGMYMRLAFAVAAHLEPEVLVVDEVLAVGDAMFQKRCLQKMQEVGAEGRTILFVSHNLAALQTLCPTGLALDQGVLIRQGSMNQVIDAYHVHESDKWSEKVVETGSFVVQDVKITSSEGPIIRTFDCLQIRIRLDAKVYVRDPWIYISLLTADHRRLAGLVFNDFQSIENVNAGDSLEVGFTVSSFPFLAGSYHLEIHLRDAHNKGHDLVPKTYDFDVTETPVYGGRDLDRWFGDIGLKVNCWHKVG